MMAAGASIPVWERPSRRRLPRFRLQEPLDVTVLRSGIPDTVPGRSVNVCERGVGVVLAGELLPGESVGVEMQLWPGLEPLRTRATVRYHDKLCCGLEFVAMSAEQRAAIRDWAKTAKAEVEVTPASKADVATLHGLTETRQPETGEKHDSSGHGSIPRRHRKRWRGAGAIVFCLLLIVAAGVFWWKWNRGWEELEAGLKNSENAATEEPRAQVPAEVMQKLVVHRVEPVYPAEARKENLEGVIALDVVVGRDGSVVSMKALNGPEVLAHAAMDALRWWKFEPYRINGEPAVVETTVAVEFKKG